jgi:hypothetical protein
MCECITHVHAIYACVDVSDKLTKGGWGLRMPRLLVKGPFWQCL